MSQGGRTVDAVGWRVTIAPEAGEIRLEHDQTGSVYVLDEDGGLRVPGGTDGGVDPAVLRTALVGALEDATAGRALPDGGQANGCTVDCDEATGEVTIESDTKISLDAPVVDIAASGSMALTSSGVLTLQGALVKVN